MGKAIFTVRFSYAVEVAQVLRLVVEYEPESPERAQHRVQPEEVGPEELVVYPPGRAQVEGVQVPHHDGLVVHKDYLQRNKRV